MKKAAGLLTGFLFIICALHAQRSTPKFFAEIAAGPAIPIGQFAETSYNGPLEEDQPGIAKTGLSANITAGYYLKENFGLLLTGGYSSNKQKEEGYRDYFSKNPISSLSQVYVDTDKWKMYKLMAGGFFVTPLVDDKLNLVTKLSAGVCKTEVPSYDWAITDMGSGVALSRGFVDKEKLPTMFCYQISLGLQYKLVRGIHVLFDVNSFNAATKKDYTVYIYSPGPGPGPSSTTTRKYKFGSVNALLGLGLSF